MSGLEILGIAASVLQIADLGARLSVKLFTVSRKVKNAKDSIVLLSQEIASTGAALHELGEVFKDDAFADIRSKNATVTTKQILADCWQVFEDINSVVGNDDAARLKPPTQVLAKIQSVDVPASFSLRQRLKYPFIEPQIELLKTKLEALKSSLVLMLQVLSIAHQIRNQPHFAIMQDQRDLIQSLIQEQQVHQLQFERLLKRIEPAPCDDVDEMTLAGSTTTINSVSMNSHTKAVNQASLLVPRSPPLPLLLRSKRKLIEHHSLLTQNLLTEVGNTRYEVNHGMRQKLHSAILNEHFVHWTSLADRFGYTKLLKMFEHHEPIASYWIDKYEEEMLEKQNSSDEDMGFGLFDDLPTVSTPVQEPTVETKTTSLSPKVRIEDQSAEQKYTIDKEHERIYVGSQKAIAQCNYARKVKATPNVLDTTYRERAKSPRRQQQQEEEDEEDENDDNLGTFEDTVDKIGIKNPSTQNQSMKAFRQRVQTDQTNNQTQEKSLSMMFAHRSPVADLHGEDLDDLLSAMSDIRVRQSASPDRDGDVVMDLLLDWTTLSVDEVRSMAS